MGDFFVILDLKSLICTFFHLFFSIKWFFRIDFGFYMFFHDLVVTLVRYDCFRLRVCVVVVVLVQLVVVSYQYGDLVFVVIMRHLFVFKRFERAKYIQS